MIPLNIAIFKSFVNPVSECASLSRHLTRDADKGPLHALQDHRKISTEFKVGFSGGDKGTKSVPASLNS